MKYSTTNKYHFNRQGGWPGRPTGPVMNIVRDWYDTMDDKYLVFEFDNKAERRSAYNTIYAATKRRGNLNVRRYVENNKVIVERL